MNMSGCEYSDPRYTMVLYLSLRKDLESRKAFAQGRYGLDGHLSST